MIKKLLLGFGILSLVIAPTLALAQSPTATESGTILKDQIKAKVQEELNAITKAVAKRGFVGTITKIADLNVTLTNLAGETRNITVATDTTIKLLSGKEGTIKDFKEKDFLIAMGDVDSAGTLTAKRIVIVAKSPTDTRQIIYSHVTKATSVLLTVTTPDNTPLSLKISSDTKLSTKSKVTSLKDIKVGDTVIAIGKPSTANKAVIAVTRLFATPGIPTTPSPTLAPTSKPTLKPTP